jgi:ribosomal protein S18 acetylase RimI-like enzyme
VPRVRALSGPPDLVTIVAERFADHPWARVCVQGATAFAGAWDLGDAVVWRSGHPWVAAPARLHALGAPAAVGAALATLRQPGEETVVPRGSVVPAQLGPPHKWTLRLRAEACTPQPGQQQVSWLTDDEAVRALLAVANPHPALWPGDELGGRWCGVEDEEGLAACAVETLPAAPRGHLSSLAVHPRARRRGLGAAITAWFTAQALEVMLAVEEDNGGADRLYDRLGFDAWPMAGYYGPDGW